MNTDEERWARHPFAPGPVRCHGHATVPVQCYGPAVLPPVGAVTEATAEPSERTATMSANVRNCPLSAENRDDLSHTQLLAIELLLTGKNFVTVAQQVGVDARTVRRWRRDEAFCAALARRCHEVWDVAAERMRALVHPAIDVLEAEVHDEYDRSRVRAAGMILRFADLRKSVPPTKEDY